MSFVSVPTASASGTAFSRIRAIPSSSTTQSYGHGLHPGSAGSGSNRPRSAGVSRPTSASSNHSNSHGLSELKPKGKNLTRPWSAKSATSSTGSHTPAFPSPTLSGLPSSLDWKTMQSNPELLSDAQFTPEDIASAIAVKFDKGRDISSNSDRNFHGMYIPGRDIEKSERFGDVDWKAENYSFIPAKFHVQDSSVIPPLDEVSAEADFDEETKQWRKTVFPSRQPSNRKEVIYLANTLDTMLSKLDETGSYDQMDYLNARKKIHDGCFTELLRQVSVHCVERGVLMKRMWGGYIDVFEGYRRLDAKKIEDLMKEQKKLREYYDKLLAEMAEKYDRQIQELQDHIKRLEDDNAILRRQIREDNWNAREKETWKNQNQTQELQNLIRKREEILEKIDKDCSRFDVLDSGDEVMGIRLAVLRRHMLADRIKEEELDPETKEISIIGLWEKDADIVGKVLEDYARVLKDRVVKDEALRRITEILDKERRRVMELLEEIEHLKQAFKRKVVTEDKDAQTEEMELEPEELPAEVQQEVIAVMKKSKPEKKTLFGRGQALPKRLMYKIINNVYTEKIIADDIDDREHNSRQSFPDFVYDYFLNKYGLKQLAEKHLANLYTTVKKFIASSVTIRLFARFLGMEDELGLPALNFYLFSRNITINYSSGTITSEDLDGRRFVNLTRAVEVSRFLFSGLETANVDKLIQKIQKSSTASESAKKKTPTTSELLANTNSKDKSSAYANNEILLDQFLEIVLDTWRNDQSEAADRMVATFRAADVDHNEELEYEEFRAMVKLVDPTVSDRKALRMFSEGIGIEGTNGLGLQSFVKICKQYSLGMVAKPDTSRGERSSKVNDFLLLDEEWRRSRPRIAKLMKKLVEDNSPDVQHFRKSIEDRIVSFMKLLQTRREVESAWISYRLLMAEVRELTKLQKYKEFAVKSQGDAPDGVKASPSTGQGVVRADKEASSPPKQKPQLSTTPNNFSESLRIRTTDDAETDNNGAADADGIVDDVNDEEDDVDLPGMPGGGQDIIDQIFVRRESTSQASPQAPNQSSPSAKQSRQGSSPSRSPQRRQSSDQQPRARPSSASATRAKVVPKPSK